MIVGRSSIGSFNDTVPLADRSGTKRATVSLADRQASYFTKAKILA